MAQLATAARAVSLLWLKLQALPLLLPPLLLLGLTLAESVSYLHC
jgi:hypothetical protein